MLITAISQQLNLPHVDLTVNIATILALCAIISPILTALINNAHHTKIKKLELKQEHYQNTVLHQREIFENYLRYTGRCIYHSDISAVKDYGEYYLSALAYAPKDLIGDMIEANDLISSYQWEEAVPMFEKITTKIHDVLQML